MKRKPEQLGLFEADEKAERAAWARKRMREMIDELAATTVNPWPDEMGPVFAGGEFERAMRCVPEAEAKALYAEFEPHFDRLYALWVKDDPNPDL